MHERRDRRIMELRASGLTQRRVAQTLGIAQSTVSRVEREAEPKLTAGEVEQPERSVPQASEVLTDKVQPGPVQGKRRTPRRPLKEEFFAVHKLLLRDVERLGRTLKDDRWREHRQELAYGYDSDLHRVEQTLARIRKEFAEATGAQEEERA